LTSVCNILMKCLPETASIDCELCLAEPWVQSWVATCLKLNAIAAKELVRKSVHEWSEIEHRKLKAMSNKKIAELTADIKKFSELDLESAKPLSDPAVVEEAKTRADMAQLIVPVMMEQAREEENRLEKEWHVTVAGLFGEGRGP
jgi:hypothetical protein